MFQVRQGRTGRARSGNGHEPDRARDVVLVAPRDISETPTNAIAHDGVSDASRCHEPASALSIRRGKTADGNKIAASRGSFFTDARELLGQNEPSRAWELQFRRHEGDYP
jgi:hypothetical protein